MVKAAIMQPTYLPWLGYFDLIDQSDAFIFLDDVQLLRRSWQLRNLIKMSDAELFLSIPVKKTASRDDLMLNAAIMMEDLRWREKHLKSIAACYKKARFFSQVFPLIEDIYRFPSDKLADFNINLITRICWMIGIKKKFYRSDEDFLSAREMHKDVKLAEICCLLKADAYLSPQGSAEYLEQHTPGGEIVKRGIKLLYQNYEHPVYHQLHGVFLSHLGCIDLLFNCGIDEMLNIIRSGRRPSFSCEEFRARPEYAEHLPQQEVKENKYE